MNHRRNSSRPADTAGPEAGLMREMFAEAAYDVTPSAIPLAAIEREGRRRRSRRRATVLGAACGVLLVPLAVVVLRGGTSPADTGTDVSSSPTVTGDASSPTPSVPAGEVRVVTPGERVQVAPGIRIWLTQDGKHWTEPGAPEPQFRSVTDGNLDMGVPGVTLQESGDGDTYFLSGIYYGGSADAARVRIETSAGHVNGTVLRLAGRQKWGVWYVMVKARGTSSTTRSPAASTAGFTERVTVYDSAGGVIVSQEFGS
jgi:hypothetical protein